MTDYLAPGDDGIVVLDRYPVTVTIDGTERRGVRAIATRTNLYVFRRDGRDAVLDLVQPYDPETAAHVGPNVPRFRTSRLSLLARDGDPVADVLIAPDEGCGCGSPLVGFVPWSPYTRGPLRTS